MPVADIADADVIVIVGSNLRHELPLVHQRVRKAWTRGAKVHVVNPVDFDFTFDIAASTSSRRRRSRPRWVMPR
jgi:NADH-quinone oxidoreductase subunit G